MLLMVVGTLFCLMVLFALGYFVMLLAGETVRAVTVHRVSVVQNRAVQNRHTTV